MTIINKLFIIIPAIGLILNMFLFLTFLAAKKDKISLAFIYLLCTFTAWTAGSLFMRLSIYPGMYFWYQVSLTGIFFSPYLYYHFFHYLTNQKGSLLKNSLFVIWTIVIFANFFDVYLKDPRLVSKGGQMSFEFTLSSFTIIPAVLCAITFFLAARMCIRAVKNEEIPKSQLIPLVVGIVLMVSGNFISTIPGAGIIPWDPLACAINAVLLYYVLYRRRLITLTHLTSKSPSYLVAATITTFLLAVSYNTIDAFYSRFFFDYLEYKTIAFAIFFSFFTVFAYSIVRHFMNNLFIKGQAAKDADLKRFSHSINNTLDLQETLDIYTQFIEENVNTELAYVYILNEETKTFEMLKCTAPMKAAGFEINYDSPLVNWLSKHNRAITYKEYKKTNSYRSMWDSEKSEIESLKIELILPIVCDSRLIGITLFSPKVKNKPFTYTEINFVESAAAILSIAFKNALLYKTIQKEAQRDALTNLYNRRYFTEQLKKDFELSRHDHMSLIIFNLDDFHLFNELYGSGEGDSILCEFANILLSVIGSRGTVARYGGKEFIVSLPLCDGRRAHQYATEVKGWLDRYLASSKEKTKKFLTFSAGICTYPTSASNIDELLTYANMGVYSAKRTGKNKIVIYADASHDRDLRTAEGASSKRAIAENCAPTIYALTAAIDAKDHYTFNHSNNVSEYAAALAEAISLDSEHVEIIRQAGLLHDIGKIGIPESILSKNTRLTAEEYNIMKQHVEGSIAMIRHLPSLDYVIPAAIGHHERWDGKGYPRGISGESIPIGARCLCIADAFDAMVSKRSYKEALSIDAALDEIRRNLGKQFDPDLGMKFIELVKEGKITVRNQTQESILTP